MGMKGLRVECGNNFMKVVRKSDGSVAGCVWWLKRKTEEGRHRVECVYVMEDTDYPCGSMPDAEVLRLVKKDVALRRKISGEALDEWLKEVIDCETLQCDLTILGEEE